jgi:hypothetical protein
MGMTIIRRYKIKSNKGSEKVRKDAGWEFTGLLDMPQQGPRPVTIAKSSDKDQDDWEFSGLCDEN